DGGSSGRLSNVKTAIREVNNLFSGLDVVEFGPLKFAAVRDAMIARGLERNYINDLMSIVVLMFNWGVEQEFVPVVGGFTGRAPDGRLCTLGRGGSDYTAVALGAALGASVELCKADTDGVYDCDPNSNSDAERFDTMTYDEAFSLASEGAKVLHDKAARSAREGEVELTVRHTFDDGPGTRIGPVADAARHVPITVPVPVTTK
ncbi:MAG: amino acid kinase family protein, partial [Planctomycetales bacterium]